MAFPKDQYMIQAFAPNRSDQAFNVRVLPRRSGCDGAVSNLHRSHPLGKGLSVCTIIVADQIAWCPVPGKCFDDLPRQPLRRRMPGHRKPQQPSSTVAHDQKGKQTLEINGRHQAEVDRSDGLRMVAQKGPPTLRWRPTTFGHVLGYRRFGDLEAELEQLTVNAGRTP